MIEKEDIYSKIIEIIHETCIYDGKINKEDSLKNDLGYDSFMMAILLDEIENAFNITFDMEDIDLGKFQTVNDLHNLTLKALSL